MTVALGSATHTQARNGATNNSEASDAQANGRLQALQRTSGNQDKSTEWGWEGGGRRTALYTREGGGGGRGGGRVGREGVAARTASVAVEGAVWDSTCSLMVTTAARRASATSPSTDSTMEAQPSAQASSRTSCTRHVHTKRRGREGGRGGWGHAIHSLRHHQGTAVEKIRAPRHARSGQLRYTSAKATETQMDTRQSKEVPH